MRRLIPLLLMLALPCAHAQAHLLNASVPSLDLQRYAGEWHEIARLPMFFERKCVANVTATYAVRDDGTIGVRNACDDARGKRLVSEGVARRTGKYSGRLEVRFVPGWLSWIPPAWADYWVVELDPDYRWAVVGGPSRDYLWVLSRSPAMPRAQFEAIRERARARGYPVDKLQLPRGTLE